MGRIYILVALVVLLIPKRLLFAETITNVNYAGDGKVAHTLNLYLPGGTGPFPVVIHYTGLAFSWSDAKSDGGLSSSYNASGIAVVGANLSGGGTCTNCATYPTQIQELKATVRFLRANASKYKLDPNFIGVIGFSSGAWNSVMLATTGDVKEYKAGNTTMNIEGTIGGNLEYSSRVQAAWAAAAPTDFLAMDSCGSVMNHGAANSPEGGLIGGALAQNKEKCALANPITYISKDDPPIHLVHGTSDNIVPTCQSVLLYNALKNSGNEKEMTYTPANGGHTANFTGSLDFFKKAISTNKEGCLDPNHPRFDPLATYCSSGDCCEKTAVVNTNRWGTVEGILSLEKSIEGKDNGVKSIDLLLAGRHTLKVYNASGALIMSKSSPGKTKYAMGGVGSGVYFVKVSDGRASVTGKIIRF